MTDRATDWTHSKQAALAFGENGAWVRHLVVAWQAANTPEGLAVPVPPDPTEAFTRSAPGSDQHQRLHDDLHAYWGPLTHLLCFGLGWTRPDLGLARWLEEGAPTEDPILRLVARWWGTDRVADLLAWAAAQQRFVEFGRTIARSGGYHRFDDTPVPDRYRERRESPAWLKVWGGGTDPLHLIGHAGAPMTYPPEDQAGGFNPVPHWGNSQTAAEAGEVPRMVIVTDTYRAWHATLWHYRPGRAPNGRSIRTDVVVKPVGWLGEYRQSTETGAWFRGRHRWHMLGN